MKKELRSLIVRYERQIEEIKENRRKEDSPRLVQTGMIVGISTILEDLKFLAGARNGRMRNL